MPSGDAASAERRPRPSRALAAETGGGRYRKRASPEERQRRRSQRPPSQSESGGDVRAVHGRGDAGSSPSSSCNFFTAVIPTCVHWTSQTTSGVASGDTHEHSRRRALVPPPPSSGLPFQELSQPPLPFPATARSWLPFIGCRRTQATDFYPDH